MTFYLKIVHYFVEIIALYLVESVTSFAIQTNTTFAFFQLWIK